MPVPRILIVEDEPKVASALGQGLEAAGYGVTVCATAQEAFAQAASGRFGLVVLDRTVAGGDGREMLRRLRSQGLPAPVLILVPDAVPERRPGPGAPDEYLTKPFAFAELLARVHDLLRRGPVANAPRLAVADLEVDFARRRACRGGRELDLTAQEFEVLEYLARRRGSIVSREMLAHDVWREPARGTPLDDVIDVQLAHLERKVDEGFARKLLHKVRGVGFVLGEEATGPRA